MRLDNYGWSDREQQRLLKLRREGLPISVIAERLGRSHDSITAKLRKLQRENSGQVRLA